MKSRHAFPWRWLIVATAAAVLPRMLTPDWPQQLGNALLIALVIAVFTAFWWLLRRIYSNHEEKIDGWAYEHRLRHPVMSLVVVLIVGATVGAVFAAGLWYAAVARPKPKEANLASSPKIDDAPTILVRYTQGSLPIEIPPNSSVLVLQLSPHITSHILEIPNTTSVPIWWPREPPKPDAEPQLGPLFVCELQNHGDKALLDVVLQFPLIFRAARRTPGSAKKNPDGKVSISVTMDTTRKDDPMAFAFVDAKRRLITGTNGAVVARHSHTVAVPVIAAKGSVSVFLVSQTKFFTAFMLPTSAQVVIDGNPTRRLAALIRPALNPTDKINRWAIQPSVYVWEGVEDSILDLDSFVAQKHVE